MFFENLRSICLQQLRRNDHGFCQLFLRNASNLSNTVENPGRVVFISQSMDVYSNLAFEDWLYQNWNFSKRHVLFLWRNSPCVVIGRHQNPFKEANLEYLNSAGVSVVRRNSGGGTVYHDHGNLNCTFFTSRDRYNRKMNLSLISDVLKRDFGITSLVNEKSDIVVGDNLKVSGTAAKLGRLCAYHHCTVLVSADKLQLKLALKGDKTLKSKATESIPSPVANLQDVYPNLTVEKLLGSIGKYYLEMLSKTGASNTFTDGFTLINPTEEWFPGLDELKTKLKSWDWLYGMTPYFKQTRPISVDESLSQGSTVLVSVEVKHCLVKNVVVESSVGQFLRDLIEKEIGNSLLDSAYTPDFFVELESRLLEKVMKPKCSSAQ